jgi:hypothetical protein
LNSASETAVFDIAARDHLTGLGDEPRQPLMATYARVVLCSDRRKRYFRLALA